MENERWLPLKGYEGLYEISDFGNVKTLAKPRIGNNHTTYIRTERKMNGSVNCYGYCVLTLTGHKDKKTVRRSVIIAEHFVPNPENKPCVNHINGIKTDDRAVNLEWVTQSENTYHAYKIGRIPSGANHINAKLTDKQVIELKNLHAMGFSLVRLAGIFNVAHSTVARILNGTTRNLEVVESYSITNNLCQTITK